MSGFPFSPSQRINDPRDLKWLQILYPVVLKSQVKVGGRGKAGGIRLVENTIDAVAAARTIFNLPIAGEHPNILLAEAHYAAQQELFLAIVQDYKRRCPVLLGSAQGGIQVEAVLAKMQKVEIVEKFSPFYARKLIHKMGLQGTVFGAVSQTVEKMYQLFVEKDLDLIEINPLAVNAEGEVMALDGKITVNDYGLGRHPDVIAFAEVQPQSEPTSAITWLKPEASVGVMSNDFNLVLAIWDLLAQNQVELGGYGIVADAVVKGLLHPPIAEIEQTLRQFAQSDVEIVLIDCLGDTAATTKIAQEVITCLQRQDGLDTAKSEERTERPTNTTARRRRARRHSPPEAARPQRRPTNSLPRIVMRLAAEVDITLLETEAAIDWADSLDKAIALVAQSV